MSTKIEWTDEVWNPITGCTKVSAGCKNCYAERMAKRLAGRYGYPKAPHQFDMTLHPDRLEKPLHWKKPRRIFVNSMSDLFHEDVHRDFILQVWRIMAICPQHTFQILTKRPERMKRITTEWLPYAWKLAFFTSFPRALDNIWLGVSIENQKTANERIPLLLQTPAAVRIVSVEPMLEPINLMIQWHDIPDCPTYYDGCNCVPNWVICGGETGPRARPMHPDWARSIRDQCRETGVPFFFKNISGRAPIPDDLMIREFPK